MENGFFSSVGLPAESYMQLEMNRQLERRKISVTTSVTAAAGPPNAEPTAAASYAYGAAELRDRDATFGPQPVRLHYTLIFAFHLFVYGKV